MLVKEGFNRGGRLPLLIGAAAVSLLTRACLIDPQKDFPVRNNAPAAAGESGQGGDGSAATSQGGAGIAAAGAAGDSQSHGGGADGGRDAGGDVLRSCAEWQANGARQDGALVIDPDADGPIASFSVFCAGMGGAKPLEYLELPHTDASGYPGMNTSTFARLGGDICPCPDSLTSSFPKVRLRVADLTILVDDRAYATFLSDPACHVDQADCKGEEMGFGEAADCRGEGVVTGRAEVDLGGTPFHIAPSATFAAFGYTPSGSVDISSDGKRASVMGGGFCGGYGPADPNGSTDGWPKTNELKLEQD